MKVMMPKSSRSIKIVVMFDIFVQMLVKEESLRISMMLG